MEALEVRNLSFRYPETEEYVLRDVSFTINAGEFVAVCGPSGCGKSTLLRQLKSALAPHGERKGEILFDGVSLNDVSFRDQSTKIGFVMQSPENQVVTDKVWHELAFGLESIGLDTPTIRRRVAEMASFFGIQNWFYKNVTELSGGQKQLLNLASVMAMQPDILILDEPTSQLDPVVAGEFLAVIGRINRELGTTVIITEHRLEEVFPMCTRTLVMDEGKILAYDKPNKAGSYLNSSGHRMFLAMPAAMRIWHSVGGENECPITAAEGRVWFEEYAKAHTLNALEPKAEKVFNTDAAIELDNITFRYDDSKKDVLKGLSLKVLKGEFYAILGGNGAGKTTTLSVINGAYKPSNGTVKLNGTPLDDIKNPFNGTLGVLPQNPQALFAEKTVYLDLREMFAGTKIAKDERKNRLDAVIRLCRLGDLLDKHPYDVSGGEQQRVALAKVLLSEPEILLLDEPTKGLDAEFKQEFAAIIKGLTDKGVTVVMVSHDVEFCAKYTDRCGMFFDGKIVSEDVPRKFFSQNKFYTTTAARMTRKYCPEAVTTEDVMEICGGEIPEEVSAGTDDGGYLYEKKQISAKSELKPLPLWRKIIAVICAVLCITVILNCTEVISIPHLIPDWEFTGYVEMLVPIIGLILCVTRRAKVPRYMQTPKEQRKLSTRTAVAAVIVLFAVPLTIFAGVTFFGDRRYLIISMLVMIECMLPFFMVFEGRKPQARELVIIAVMCALGVAGRVALFMVPNFKPVIAIVIISGVAFGGETGFLVGAMTMLASNMMFSQGTWTPWQMFAMGIIGFLSGVLFKKGFLRRDKLAMGIFGFLMTVVVYGGIMNPAAALMSYADINWQTIAAYYLSGLPVDTMQGVATFLFLYLGAEPMLEKLDRIKVKYGLIN